MKKFFAEEKAFTLIEILVVITISGILAVIGLGSYHSSQIKARDTKRKADVSNVSEALEMYYNDHGRFPEANDGEIMGVAWGSEFSSPEGVVYMKELPSDPINNVKYFYETDESGSYYRLYTILENHQDPSFKNYFPDGGEEEYNYCIASSNKSCIPVIASGPSEPTSIPTSIPSPANPVLPTSAPVSLTVTPSPTVTLISPPDCVYYECTTEQGGCFATCPFSAGDITYGYGCSDDWCVGCFDRGQEFCDGGKHFYSWFKCTLYPGQGDGESLWCASEPDGWSGVYYLEEPAPTPIPPTNTPVPTSTPIPCPEGTCQTSTPGCPNYCHTACQTYWGPGCNNNPIPGSWYTGCGCKWEGEVCGGECPSVMCCDGFGCDATWHCVLCPEGTCQTSTPGCPNYCNTDCQTYWYPGCDNNPIPGSFHTACGCKREGEVCGGECPSVMCCDGLKCDATWHCVP